VKDVFEMPSQLSQAYKTMSVMSEMSVQDSRITYVAWQETARPFSAFSGMPFSPSALNFCFALEYAPVSRHLHIVTVTSPILDSLLMSDGSGLPSAMLGQRAPCGMVRASNYLTYAGQR